MNLNATLFAQTLVFLILAWFTMKFVWPPLIKAIDERSQKIADGLAAAEKGRIHLELADKQVVEVLTQAREEGAKYLSEAEKHTRLRMEELKREASEQAARIISEAKHEAEQQALRARDALREELAILAVKGAEQILKREINADAHRDILSQIKAAF